MWLICSFLLYFIMTFEIPVNHKRVNGSSLYKLHTCVTIWRLFVIEHVVSKQLLEYIHVHDLGYSHQSAYIYLAIYLGFLCRFQHCTGHIPTGSWKGRGNHYIQFIRVLYCKLPTNTKQLPAFPLEAVPGTEPRPQRWEARVLPLCHRGPSVCL